MNRSSRREQHSVRPHAPLRFSPVYRYGLLFVFMMLVGGGDAWAQPALSASAPEQARAGEPFVLEVEARWTGPAERYMLYPPRVALPVKVQQSGLRQFYETRGTETVYHYQYTLVAEEAGEQQLGPITLEYRDMQADASAKPEPVRDEGPSVQVQPGGAKGWVGTLAPPAAVLAAVVAVLAWRRRRARLPGGSSPAAPAGPTPEVLLEQARHALAEGRQDEVYALLSRVKPLLPGGSDPLPPGEQLEEARLRARYGGVQGTREELERLVRAAELAVRPSRHET